MSTADVGLLEIVREFLRAHRALHLLFQRQRSGELRWDEVEGLVGSDESSVLFRLKERCHALFRSREGGADLPRVALFDLAVGSLFHEAMKLRENFYQLEVYAPKVEKARSEAGPGTEALFGEFAKILSASRDRLYEALEESEALLEQTRQQFRGLLAAHRSNGLLVRYLLEHREMAEEVLGESLDEFLLAIYGDPVEAYALAARSYLASGYFREAERSFQRALERDGRRVDLRSGAAFAAGMGSFLRGRYAEALKHLEEWVEAGIAPVDLRLAELAHSALSSLDQFVEEEERLALAPRAAQLTARLEPLLAEG